MSHVLALTTEAFLKVGLSDEASVVDIEVMEGKEHVSISHSLSAINSDSKELSVVDFAIVVEVNSLENRVQFLLAQVQFLEGLSHLTENQSATIVSIKGPKGISELGKIKGRCVDLIDKEFESLDLEIFWLSEVLDTSEDHEFVFSKESWVVAGMVCLDIV